MYYSLFQYIIYICNIYKTISISVCDQVLRRMALFAEQTINYFKKIIKVAWHFSDFTVSHILGGLKSKPPAQLQAKKKKKEEENWGK